MRSLILILVLVLFGAPVLAAPICLRVDGVAARCGTAGAMPVGWRPSARQRLEQELAHPPQDATPEIVGAVALLGSLAALIALMPKFDGWSDDDWDEQEGERRGRRG